MFCYPKDWRPLIRKFAQNQKTSVRPHPRHASAPVTALCNNQKCTAEETPARVGVIRLTLRASVDRRAPRPLFERFVIIPHFFAFVKWVKATIFCAKFRDFSHM